ncbi:hypothetical protein QQ045_004348 [Rhodiola kirilowii]
MGSLIRQTTDVSIRALTGGRLTDWDLRLASLLLLAFDQEENFWQLYGDFLPSADECTSLLLASQDDLSELQDQNLASTMREQRRRALEFWERNWHSAVPLKIKRLARDPERFIWAVAIAQSRCINMQMRVGCLSGGGGGSFVDGAVLAAARTIPTWSDKDLPPIPSQEQSAVKELQGQCQQMLAEYPTTSEQDHEILESMPESRRTFYQVFGDALIKGWINFWLPSPQERVVFKKEKLIS